ncbi:MAG: HEAT repeat domain-containing protein [Planctomycetes bacterium]|nr:HEAT repeat domain-containing protein [Planctomycetota bacterium]
MAAALEKTYEVLIGSRNESAGPVLMAALESDDSVVFEGALKAIVARRSKAGHLAVLERWHQLSPDQRKLVHEGRGRLSGAIRDSVLSDDTQLFENACELVREFSEFDLVPTLVTLAENQKSNHAQAATELVLQQVDRLSEMVRGPRDYSDRRDPESIRRYVLESLERSVERFRSHKRPELIEAFVVLGGPSCGLLRDILEDTRHACYKTVTNTLETSESAGVIDLLLSFLKTNGTSLNVLNIISRRADKPFVTQLLECTEDDVFSKITKNLGRMRSLAWLTPEESVAARFDEQDQARCVKLAVALGTKQGDLIELLKIFLELGEPASRLAVCEALISIPGDQANRMVLDSIRDNDPLVQASATRQLRDRHVPGAMAILLKQLDSTHGAVQKSAREALSEFSFKNFLISFDSLPEDARQSTGRLVCKVDPETVPGLASEMESKSRKCRMRAIEMIEVMGLISAMSKNLVELLDDEDHLVRVASADALQFSPTAEVQEALQHALTDRSGAVQNAARASLASIEEQLTGLPTGGQ